MNVAVVFIGQPAEPPGLIGTLTEVNTTFDGGFAVGVAELPLMNRPVTFAGRSGAAMAVHVLPKMETEAETPRCGTASVPVGCPPVFATQSIQAPVATTVPLVFRLVVHPENVGAVIGPQTPVAGTLPLTDELVQVTITGSTMNVTLVDVAVKASPRGETESANAGGVPSPIVAAIAGATRRTIDLRTVPAARGASGLTRIWLASMA